MGLSIKNDATEARVRAVAALTGDTLTGAIDRAIRELHERLQAEQLGRVAGLAAIVDAFKALPVLDERPSQVLFDALYDDVSADDPQT